MDSSYGKKVVDPFKQQKARIQDSFKDLNSLRHVYLWGDPGCGKQFLVDLFYETLDVGARKKKMHYSEFMLLMHEMEHDVNKKLKGRTGETIAIVGNQFA